MSPAGNVFFPCGDELGVGMADALIVTELEAVDACLIQLRLPGELRRAAVRGFEKHDLASRHRPRQRMSQRDLRPDAARAEHLCAAPIHQRDLRRRRAPFIGELGGPAKAGHVRLPGKNDHQRRFRGRQNSQRSEHERGEDGKHGLQHGDDVSWRTTELKRRS